MFRSWCSKHLVGRGLNFAGPVEKLVCIAKISYEESLTHTHVCAHTCTHTHTSNQKSLSFKINNKNFSCWLWEERLYLPSIPAWEDFLRSCIGLVCWPRAAEIKWQSRKWKAFTSSSKLKSLYIDFKLNAKKENGAIYFLLLHFFYIAFSWAFCYVEG